MMASVPQIVLRFDSLEALQKEFQRNLRTGGAFSPGTAGLAERTPCILVLTHPDSGKRLELPAEVVYVKADDPGKGVGVHIQDFGPALIETLREFCSPASHQEPAPQAQEEEGFKPAAAAIADRLRNLSTAEQLKVAREGGLPQRVALERIYGKAVWEALLQNPRVSPPEVARIARMGMAPLPVLELICGNAAWLAAGEVRRALLSNPRLGEDSMMRVLRAMPRHELSAIATQTAYAQKIRKAAKGLLQK